MVYDIVIIIILIFKNVLVLKSPLAVFCIIVSFSKIFT